MGRRFEVVAHRDPEAVPTRRGARDGPKADVTDKLVPGVSEDKMVAARQPSIQPLVGELHGHVDLGERVGGLGDQGQAPAVRRSSRRVAAGGSLRDNASR